MPLPSRRTVHRAMALILVVAWLVAGAGRVAAASALDATPVEGGAFFERADTDGLGFAIRNYADGPTFYGAFLRFGGAEVLGPPVSRPWIADGGFAYQLTQRALFSGRPRTDGWEWPTSSSYWMTLNSPMNFAPVTSPLPKHRQPYRPNSRNRPGWPG